MARITYKNQTEEFIVDIHCPDDTIENTCGNMMGGHYMIFKPIGKALRDSLTEEDISPVISSLNDKGINDTLLSKFGFDSSYEFLKYFILGSPLPWKVNAIYGAYATLIGGCCVECFDSTTLQLRYLGSNYDNSSLENVISNVKDNIESIIKNNEIRTIPHRILTGIKNVTIGEITRTSTLRDDIFERLGHCIHSVNGLGDEVYHYCSTDAWNLLLQFSESLADGIPQTLNKMEPGCDVIDCNTYPMLFYSCGEINGSRNCINSPMYIRRFMFGAKNMGGFTWIHNQGGRVIFRGKPILWDYLSEFSDPKLHSTLQVEENSTEQQTQFLRFLTDLSQNGTQVNIKVNGTGPKAKVIIAKVHVFKDGILNRFNFSDPLSNADLFNTLKKHNFFNTNKGAKLESGGVPLLENISGVIEVENGQEISLTDTISVNDPEFLDITEGQEGNTALNRLIRGLLNLTENIRPINRVYILFKYSPMLDMYIPWSFSIAHFDLRKLHKIKKVIKIGSLTPEVKYNKVKMAEESINNIIDIPEGYYNGQDAVKRIVYIKPRFINKAIAKMEQMVENLIRETQGPGAILDNYVFELDYNSVNVRIYSHKSQKVLWSGTIGTDTTIYFDKKHIDSISDNCGWTDKSHIGESSYKECVNLPDTNIQLTISDLEGKDYFYDVLDLQTYDSSTKQWVTHDKYIVKFHVFRPKFRIIRELIDIIKNIFSEGITAEEANAQTSNAQVTHWLRFGDTGLINLTVKPMGDGSSHSNEDFKDINGNPIQYPIQISISGLTENYSVKPADNQEIKRGYSFVMPPIDSINIPIQVTRKRLDSDFTETIYSGNITATLRKAIHIRTTFIKRTGILGRKLYRLDFGFVPEHTNLTVLAIAQSAGGAGFDKIEPVIHGLKDNIKFRIFDLRRRILSLPMVKKVELRLFNIRGSATDEFKKLTGVIQLTPFAHFKTDDKVDLIVNGNVIAYDVEEFKFKEGVFEIIKGELKRGD